MAPNLTPKYNVRVILIDALLSEGIACISGTLYLLNMCTQVGDFVVLHDIKFLGRLKSGVMLISQLVVANTHAVLAGVFFCPGPQQILFEHTSGMKELLNFWTFGCAAVISAASTRRCLSNSLIYPQPSKHNWSSGTQPECLMQLPWLPFDVPTQESAEPSRRLSLLCHGDGCFSSSHPEWRRRGHLTWWYADLIWYKETFMRTGVFSGFMASWTDLRHSEQTPHHISAAAASEKSHLLCWNCVRHTQSHGEGSISVPFPSIWLIYRPISIYSNGI